MVLYARDILETDFLILSKETSVLEAAKAMRDTKHGFAMIGPQSNPEGVVTEWDILSKVVAQGRDASGVRLGEIMTTDLVHVEVSDGIAAISQMMSERGIRRLLVEDQGKVVGYITSRIILANLNAYVDKVSAQISRLQAPWF